MNQQERGGDFTDAEKRQHRDRQAFEVKGTWRDGRSKRHKYPCSQCGGLLHERGRGRHFSRGFVLAKLAKLERERERAAACGYVAGQAGQVAQAG